MMKRTHQTPTGEQANQDDTAESEPVAREQETAGVTHDPDTAPRSVAKDDAFHVLQNARRRAVLRYLLAHPDQERFRMRDLAEEVAAWEHDTTVRQLTSDERQRVYIALYQSHLPKLDDHGVIRYNQDRGIVEPTPLLVAFEPFLEDGLHADTEHLTLDAFADGSGEDGGHTDFVNTISSLFTR